MVALAWWLLVFGIWPLADPGHTDLGSLLVWVDLGLHYGAGWFLLDRWVERRAIERAERRTRA